MDEATVRYIEKMGGIFEQWNQPRIGGQIVGLLLVTDSPGLTAHDLAQLLGASSGSISTMTSLLVRLGAVEKLKPPGDRRFRFRVVDNFLLSVSREKLLAAHKMHDLMTEGSRVAKNDTTRTRLEEMADFYLFFEQEATKLIDRWVQMRSKFQSPSNQEVK